MTQFNQELITKARKGEIAILNDGSIEELRGLLKEVFPNDCTAPRLTSGSKFFMAHFSNNDFWQCDTATHLPAHSVKDFFMPDTKDNDQPRTYKVTRGQMKEIWEAAHLKDNIRKIAIDHFAVFADTILIDHDVFLEILRSFNQKQPEVLVKHFPEYFFIPEGEPVLVRDSKHARWSIGISDGNGHASSEVGGSPYSFKQIIPYTKNPPK